MSKKFKRLLVPEGYRHYWSKYPEGYTILEALLNWVDSVNQLTENVNDWNIYLEDFVENFDERLIPTVRDMLNEMEQDNRLSDLINEVIFSELNDKVDAKADKIYVDNEISNINSDFNDMKDTAFKGIHKVNNSDKTVVSRSTRGSLVILDDDVRNQSYDLLFNFAKENNVKVTMAVITSRVMEGNSRHISIEQLEEMRDSGLVEFVNHSHTHQTQLTNLSDSELIEEFEQSQRFLTSHGIFTDHLVYPFGGGSIDERVKRIASQYFNSASRSNGKNVSPHNEVIDSLELGRVVFETPEATISERIDEAAQNGSTLILNTHSQYETFDLAKLQNIVDMAKSAGIDILHFSEAFARFKNLIEIRKDNDDLLGGISSQGVLAGIFDPQIKHITLGDTNITNSSLPTAYENHMITSATITNTLKNERGFPATGRLLNFRSGSDDYTFQLLHEVNTGHIYKRYWETRVDLEWSPWRNLTDNQKDIRHLSGDDFTVDNDSPTNEYENNIISSFNVTRNIRDERGFPAIGRLLNYRSGSDDYTFQMLHEHNSHSIYKRYWNNVNGVWSEWLDIVEKTHTFLEENISIDAGAWQNLNFDIPGVSPGDVVSLTIGSSVSNEILITGPFISVDDRVRIRLNNISENTLTIAALNVSIKKM